MDTLPPELEAVAANQPLENDAPQLAWLSSTERGWVPYAQVAFRDDMVPVMATFSPHQNVNAQNGVNKAMKIVQKKICLLGDFAVGKTSLVRRFVEDRFDDKYLSTIGVKISRKTLMQQDTKLNLLVWDLVGGNQFSRAETGYLLGTAGALIVCDLTRPDTLEPMRRYTSQMRAVNPNVALILLGNKVDLTESRAIDEDMITAVSTELNAPFHFTSAKTGKNVEVAFSHLADLIEGENT